MRKEALVSLKGASLERRSASASLAHASSKQKDASPSLGDGVLRQKDAFLSQKHLPSSLKPLPFCLGDTFFYE
jgi:hypothetical protein